jgi:hypothetical protein
MSTDAKLVCSCGAVSREWRKNVEETLKAVASLPELRALARTCVWDLSDLRLEKNYDGYG